MYDFWMADLRMSDLIKFDGFHFYLNKSSQKRFQMKKNIRSEKNQTSDIRHQT